MGKNTVVTYDPYKCSKLLRSGWTLVSIAFWCGSNKRLFTLKLK